MKKKLEVQTIIVLLCALLIAGAWIGIQIKKDSLGVWTESSELHLSTDDLLGLGPRSELRCAGTVIGHVRTVTPDKDLPIFTIIAGVKPEFAKWRFANKATIKLGVVQSALSPSSINLTIDDTSSAVQPCRPKQANPPVVTLIREPPKNDIEHIGNQINGVIRQFTETQKGHKKAATQELTDAIQHLSEVAASLAGQSHSPEVEPAKRPPVDRLMFNLVDTTGNLKSATASLESLLSRDGKLDTTLTTLNARLMDLEELTDAMATTVNRLNLRVDTSLRKMNGLVDETTGTMTSLHDKVDRFGETWLGRRFIGEKKTTPQAGKNATPAPRKNAGAPH